MGISPLCLGEQETSICRCHIPLMNSLHSRLCGRDMCSNSSAELGEKARHLRQCLEGVDRHAVMAGGRVGLLAWQLLDMAECLLSRDHPRAPQPPRLADLCAAGNPSEHHA
jgi:hypothetical protein